MALKVKRDKVFESRCRRAKNGCLIWMGSKNNMGYGTITRSRISKSPMYVHRYAWFLKHGHMPEDNLLHKCDTPLCVETEHLREGTQLDNLQDAKAKGRMSRGEHRPLAKLTERAVRFIRKSDDTNQNLARRFDVSPAAVYLARKYQTWTHVQ